MSVEIITTALYRFSLKYFLSRSSLLNNDIHSLLNGSYIAKNLKELGNVTISVTHAKLVPSSLRYARLVIHVTAGY